MTLKLAVSAGIGLFIAFIGMQAAGAVVANARTLVKLGDVHTRHQCGSRGPVYLLLQDYGPDEFPELS
jgi:xanthine/uracil/vitamin C permease (AzgA family)